MTWDTRYIDWELCRKETRDIVKMFLSDRIASYYANFSCLYPHPLHVGVFRNEKRQEYRVLRPSLEKSLCRYSDAGLELRCVTFDHCCIYLLNQIIFVFQNAGLITDECTKFAVHQGGVFYITEGNATQVADKDTVFLIPVNHTRVPSPRAAASISYQDTLALLLGGGS